MNFSVRTQKQIGTLVPIAALHSTNIFPDDAGTFAVGVPFLHWLRDTKQCIWQLLPLHPTQFEPDSMTHVPSPYKGYGIGLDPKYLPSSFRDVLPTPQQKKEFLLLHAEWVYDYALFCSLRDYFHTDDWRKWDQSLRIRDPDAIDRWTQALAKEIDSHVVLQWQLHTAYDVLKSEAKKIDIQLAGDIPFYLSLYSPLAWAHQNAFELQSDGSVSAASGVTDLPSSFFGRQVWGHPLYNWESKDDWDEIIDVWKIRLRYMKTLVDYLRFDYAQAFYHYGAIDTSDDHHDHNRVGPGEIVFEELVRYSRELGLSVCVEDSATEIKAMKKTLIQLQCPCIKIFRFALDENTDKLYEEYANVSSYSPWTVASTTTHDTETLVSYVEKLATEQKKRLAIASGATYDPDMMIFAKNLRDTVIASPALAVIIPIQDWLLTTERINIPGTETEKSDPNWQYTVSVPIEEFPL